ncbi:hypothetical protein GCM10008111_27250 [Alishewanella tabrizica]|uniref:DNA-binding protein n=1 Tax=Alishewanella tabrizica TaxID=671278 RepID=A0ABQ2WS92_9ALTE|nr:hypothetical protein GCM10008111_27250 [Alishewanella tabrizica]
MANQCVTAMLGVVVVDTCTDGQARVQCRFESDTLWLSQAAMAGLYQVSSQAITRHVKAICSGEELEKS